MRSALKRKRAGGLGRRHTTCTGQPNLFSLSQIAVALLAQAEMENLVLAWLELSAQNERGLSVLKLGAGDFLGQPIHPEVPEFACRLFFGGESGGVAHGVPFGPAVSRAHKPKWIMRSCQAEKSG